MKEKLLRFLKKTLKVLSKILLVIAIIIASLCLFLQIARQVYYQLKWRPVYDEEEISLFLEHKQELESINNYILQNFDYKAKDKDNILYIPNENGRVDHLYDGGDIELSEELQEDFTILANALLRNEQCFVEITKKRISYQSIGRRMYVYSRNGKPPRYFYNRGDGMHPDVYNLGDNWYLMIVNYL